MRIPIQHVLLTIIISVTLSSPNQELDDNGEYDYGDHLYEELYEEINVYSEDVRVAKKVCIREQRYMKFVCINHRELCPNVCKRYKRADTTSCENWQTTYLSNPLQYYFCCAKPYRLEFHAKEGYYYSIEFAENCSIPNVSFAEIFNAVENQELVNGIRFKSFSNNDIVLQSYHFENLTSLRRLHIERNMARIYELTHDIFEKISVLKELSLNNVGITVQLLKPLARLIVNLELAFNNLTTLNDNIFLNFFEMKFLSIKGNNFHNISKYVFNSTLELIQLDLIDNNIKYLEDEVFGNLFQLKHLNLSYNNLTKLPNKLFAGATKLVNISIDANKLTELPEDLFKYCFKIKFISLKNNCLKSIPVGLFKHNLDLQELDISDNQLQQVDGFSNDIPFWSSNLRKLRLAKNHLNYLFSSTYSYIDFTSLVELDVSHNSFNIVTRSKVPYLGWNKLLEIIPNVEVINFRNNSLKELKRSSYWKNIVSRNLKMVDLSYNQFDYIFVEYFIPRSKIHPTFNFTNNPIRYLDFDGVDHRLPWSGIATIILEYNSIECNCYVFSLAKYIQEKSHSLVKNYIRLESSDEPSCQLLNSKKKIPLNNLTLEHIICPMLEENGILKVDYKQPVDFDFKRSPRKCDYRFCPVNGSIIMDCSNQPYNLQLLKQYDLIKQINNSVELILTNNNIDSLSDEISNLSWIPSLIKLSLSSNSLKNVDELLIPNTLVILELDNNEISHLNDEVISRINESDKLTSITLHNNPWECSCKTKNMIKFFQDIQNKIINQGHNVICNETGDSVFRVSTEYLCQGFFSKQNLFFIIALILALAFAVTLIVLLCYIYNNEIKVWMYANKYLSWLVTEQDIDKDKQYDAFISFCGKDTRFVENELLPELEESDKHLPLKLCVHYRDFIVGEYIPTQIDHFVKISKRTVILLSSNFLKSEWSKIEFRTAHLESIRENRPKVITILLEEIDEEDLDDDLRKYISLYTYLKWDDPWFWKKLRYALPHS